MLLLILQQIAGVASGHHASCRTLAEDSLISDVVLDVLALHLDHLGHLLIDDVALLHQQDDGSFHSLENSSHIRTVEQS